jgi:hypothetical protein
MQILKAEDIGFETHLKALIYGPAGDGKTTFALNTEKRVAYVCSEWKQAKITWQWLARQGVLNPATRVFPCSHAADLRETRKYLMEHPKEFDLVVLDNLTDCQDFLKVEQLAEGKERDLEVLSMGEWQVLIDKTVGLVKAFRDLPDMSVVFIGHYVESQDEKARRFIRPSLLGKTLPSRLSSLVNVVGYLHKERVGDRDRREIVFSGPSTILTKPHSCLQDVEYANLDFIMAKIGGAVEVECTYNEWRKSSASKTVGMEEVGAEMPVEEGKEVEPEAPEEDPLRKTQGKETGQEDPLCKTQGKGKAKAKTDTENKPRRTAKKEDF